MKLWLLRHAQTDADPGVCFGSTDIGVSVEATQALARQIAPLIPADAVLSCSPLQRCAELAQAIEAIRPELAASADTRLAEMDFGAWEGREWSAISRAEFDGWIGNFADAHPGGTGESTRQFMRRVGDAFDEWQISERDGFWITHAGVIRATQLLARGVRVALRAEHWPQAPIEFGEILVVEV
ncbi:histidine phosphatase family protein [Variovorax robiniae]|uniref:Histidine phosphatase family protein n=1 Tax=Variovorax robiniae TaxID=1836199 RepID=A0ABU8X9F8_9BURK